MNPGSAARYLEGFAAEMASVGYTSLTISFYLSSAIHLGGWVEASGLDFANINEETIQAFAAHRCQCPGRLDAAPRNTFHVIIWLVFSASPNICGNRAPSGRVQIHGPKSFRP